MICCNFKRCNKSFSKELIKYININMHILSDRRWHSSIIDVLSFRGADCTTDHYLVIGKVRECLAVRKQAAQKSDGGRFNLRKLNDLHVRKEYQKLQTGLQL